MAFGTDCGLTPFTQANLLDAEKLFREALEKLQEQIGSETSDYILKLDLLAECLEMQDKWEAAEKYRRELFEQYQRGKKPEGFSFP